MNIIFFFYVIYIKAEQVKYLVVVDYLTIGSYAILERTSTKRLENFHSMKTRIKMFAEHTIIIQLHYISRRHTYIIIDHSYDSQYILQCVFFS